MLSLNITLEKNNGQDRLNVPYTAHVDCPELIHYSRFEIPIRASYTGMKKTYGVEVAGFRLTTELVGALTAIVARLIEGISRAGRVPDYVFIARDAGIVYPVYTLGDEVFTPTPYGPVFQHVELAVIRQQLSDYLHEVKILGAHGRADKFHVRGVDPQTLQLIRPCFYLKKRVPNENEFWAPVFKSAQKLYTQAASEKREVPLDNGREVLALQSIVAEALEKDGRLNNRFDLRPDRLFRDEWEALKNSSLEEMNETLTVSTIPLKLYRTVEGQVIALEERAKEDRYSLFLGSDIADVKSRALRDFTRRGVGV